MRSTVTAGEALPSMDCYASDALSEAAGSSLEGSLPRCKGGTRSIEKP